jgi:DNA-binding PadR family transcriptional regulator
MFNNFGKGFAYQSQGSDWSGWTPPWINDDRQGPRHGHGHHHHHGHHSHRDWQEGPRGWQEEQRGRDWQEGPRGRGWQGPRFFGMQRRGPFGHGGPFGGPRGPFGPQGPGEGHRFFGRGDVKYALLELLRERPMHGYEMIKALEEKSGGFYTPSAGTIYPTLQMLEDRSFVTVSETEGKKVYSITDTGRAFLAEQQKETEQFAGPPWARGGRGGMRGNPEAQALRSEAAEVARLFAIAGRSSFNNPEQFAKVRAIIERTRAELSDLIYSTSTEAKTETSEQSGTPDVEQA